MTLQGSSMAHAEDCVTAALETSGPPLKFTVATWNMNSVRLRIDLVTRYLAEHKPDVLCLQETKCPDANFPHGAFRDAGYPHIAVCGQKGYHGVAVVSRVPLTGSSRRDFCSKGNCVISTSGSAARPRVWSCIISTSRRAAIHSDPETNDKFAHKLAFLDEMATRAAEDKAAGGQTILVGDLNIAPLENDVWSHKALVKVVSHTAIEVEKLKTAQAAGNWVDAVRKLLPPDQKLYSWWSYRSPDWSNTNKGRRLDHIWVSPALEPAVESMHVSA